MTKIEFEHRIPEIRGNLLAVARSFTKVSRLAIDAEDIVQEALTELWMLCESGYEIQNLEALAVKITKTVCVRHYRSSERIQTASIEGVDYPGGSAASERIDVQEALRMRKFLFEKLNDTQRQCLKLRSEQEMSLDEIAIRTGKTKSSVKATISQARKIINELLKKI